MGAILEVLSGADAPRRVRLEPGRALRVGRGDRAGLRLATDAQVSGQHFELTFDGERCMVRDLGSAKGTLLEGERVGEGEARDGDMILAGETWLRVRIRPEGVRVPGGEERLPEGSVRSLLAAMREHGGRLYALLDAARDPRVLVLLRESEDDYGSLYEGLSVQTMSEEAPYLVELQEGSWLAEALLREGFGLSWGVLVASRRPPAEVRRHFRQFLFVRDDADRELYFRFYDPRVLRVFLPTCSPRQLSQLFEGIEAYWVESEGEKGFLRFAASSGHELLAHDVPHTSTMEGS